MTMKDLHITKVNEVYLRINSDDSGILMEINEHFTFEVPGARFNPKFKAKLWNGKISIFSAHTRLLPYGLLFELIKFCDARNYTYDIDKEVVSKSIPTRQELIDYVDSLKLTVRGEPVEMRDYQLNAFIHAVQEGRCLTISPTACLDAKTLICAKVNNVLNQYNFFELFEAYHKGKSIKLPTPDGLKEVIGAYKKRGPGIKIEFDDGTETIGSDFHLVQVNNEFVALNTLKVNDVLDHKNSRITRIVPVKAQDWYDFSLDYDKECYYQNGIIHHNSGKSLIIYALIRWYLDHYEEKILIVVPTVALCSQMKSDFDDYSSADNNFDAESEIHLIYSGQEKLDVSQRILISTWQSIFTQHKNQFLKFGMVICDEVHLAVAKSLNTIMNNLINANYRIGTTGTLDGAKCNELVLVGNFGPVNKVITTKELMDSDTIAQLKIRCLVLNHNNELKKIVSKLEYQDEINAIIGHEGRNNFITKLAIDQKGNTLILFNRIEDHGKPLYKKVCDVASKDYPDRKIFYVSGEVNAKAREEIRAIAETETNCIILASVVFATGTNLRNIHTIIFAAPTKSQVRVLQSIGRGLRKSDNGKPTTLYDISDNFSWKSKKNFTMKHAKERIDIYNKEQFDYKIFEIDIA